MIIVCSSIFLETEPKENGTCTAFLLTSHTDREGKQFQRSVMTEGRQGILILWYLSLHFLELVCSQCSSESLQRTFSNGRMSGTSTKATLVSPKTNCSNSWHFHFCFYPLDPVKIGNWSLWSWKLKIWVLAGYLQKSLGSSLVCTPPLTSAFIKIYLVVFILFF